MTGAEPVRVSIAAEVDSDGNVVDATIDSPGPSRYFTNRALLVVAEQIAEVAHLMQALLVVAHTGLHQQTGDPVLHLHRLSPSQN